MQVPEESHYFFSSESVTEGHPDKICDIISDSILDACLTQDPNSKVAVETVAKSNMILLAGELTTKANINIGLWKAGAKITKTEVKGKARLRSTAKRPGPLMRKTSQLLF